MAQKELNKLREQFQNAEQTREQALEELDRAKKAVDSLTEKLAVINESKELALKASEAAMTQSIHLKEDSTSTSDEAGQMELDQTREQYAAAVTDVDAAKQELRRMRKEFEALVETKIFAFNQESEAKQHSKENSTKADQLSKEIAELQESLTHVKLAAEQAQEEESRILSERESTRNSYRLSLEETDGKLAALKRDFNPGINKELESKLAETDAEICAIRKKVEAARSSALQSVNSVTTELDEAKQVLQKVAGDESILRTSVESLKMELETVIKEHSQLNQKGTETEALVADLHTKLQSCKSELEEAMEAESKANSASDDLMATLKQLQSESEIALRDAQVLKKESDALRSEAESARTALSETEEKLEAALKEAEEAKAEEAVALNEIKALSAKTSEALLSTSAESEAAEIMISKEEYETLGHKVEESEKLTGMKVAAAAAQVEAVKASEAEAAKKLEVILKEIEELEAARADALKRAEMADGAKKAVESELRKWREKEQKKAAEAAVAARLLAVEREEEAMPTEVLSPLPSKPPASTAETKTSKTKKSSSLLPSLSGIFHRKKSSADLSHGEKDKRLS